MKGSQAVSHAETVDFHLIFDMAVCLRKLHCIYLPQKLQIM